ncbi:MAG: protein kinase [Anaerolineales bacterium]|nr:protein kinase [Anaerolineales bacterium]
MPFIIGENVGPYRLIEKLGKGGMATVFKAYHPSLDRYVAIKALHPAFMEHPGFIDRFEREAKVVAKLDHPNIVPIYDFSEHEDRPYLVLKYVRGETLKARLEKSKLTYKESRHIFRVISSALAYAHQEGVLHRDVKPSNVLLEKGGQIYLADFGLARMTETSQTTLSGQMMMGTPHYISPEQAKGLGGLDSGTDIYSLGVMMYELLVGEVPFQADTPFSVIHDHIYSPLPLPRDMNPDLNDDIQRAILKSLAKKREDRYKKISDMMAMFLKAFDTLIIEHPSDGDAPTLTLKSDARQTATQRAVAAEGSVETEGTSATVNEEKTRKKGIPGWIWWMAIPALLTLWLGMMVIDNALEPPSPNLISAETLTQEASIKSDPVLGEIQTLNQLIRENPEDPFYRYQLGVAYLEADRPQLARDAFQKAYQLAEGKPEIIIELGDRLTDINIWTYAAYSYLMADQIGSPLSPEEMKNKISEAVYFAAFEEYSFEILTSREVNLDPALRRLLEARKALLTGKIDVAERLADQVMHERPDLLEVYLIKSDILFAQKRYDEAKDLLLDLEQIENLPLWIQEEIPSQTEQ